MATLNRFRYVWQGSGVTGGGVSTFYSESGDVAVFNAAVRAFLNSIAPSLPATVEIVPPAAGETIDEVSGAVNGVWSQASPPALIVGSGGGNFAAGVGFRVVWNTGAIVRRRRVRGSTYIVPVTIGTYDTAGTIQSGTVTGVTTTAGTLIAADGGSMRVYSRPQTPTSNDGVAHTISSASVPDKVSWLRSRRT